MLMILERLLAPQLLHFQIMIIHASVTVFKKQQLTSEMPSTLTILLKIHSSLHQYFLSVVIEILRYETSTIDRK